MNKNTQHFLVLTLAILFMSSSGTVGSYTTVSPEVAIWVRCVIGSLALWMVLKLTKTPTSIGWKRDFRLTLLSSVFMGTHWVLYFYALSLTNVAIGMLSLFTYPLLTSLLEPLMLKTKLKLWNVSLAIIAFIGVFFLIPEYSLGNNTTIGILLGILSALLYSVRNILMKESIARHSGITLMYYNLLVICIVLTPVLFFVDFDSNMASLAQEWHALLALGLITTAIGHTLFVVSFGYFSITTVSIISNLTPLLGIVLGYLFLDQIPNERVFIGGSIIMVSVMAESAKTIFGKN